MKQHFLTITLLSIIGVACGTVSGNVSAQAQKTSPPAGSRGCDESGRERLAQAQQASLTPAERLAWREIQERIDRMSHGEEAKDLRAATRLFDSLRLRLENKIERCFGGPPKLFEASGRNDLAHSGFTRLRPECESHFL